MLYNARNGAFNKFDPIERVLSDAPRP
jgi:hypothetical protein